MSEEVEGVLVENKQELSRSLGIERVYNLGDYKSIRFSDYVANLPERVALNAELVDKIRYLQLVNVELHYRQYIQLAEKLKTAKLESIAEVIQLLEDEKTATLQDIKTILFDNE